METTVQTRRHWVQKDSGQFDLVALENLRPVAAEVNRRAMWRKARAYAPFLSAKKVSEQKVHALTLMDLARQMAAMAKNGDTESVEMVVGFVNSVRDTLLEGAEDPVELTELEQKANAHEDELSLAYMAGRACPQALVVADIEHVAIKRRRVAALLRGGAE